MTKKGLFAAISALMISLLLSGCYRSNVVASVGENQLFDLHYGNFEEELNLFDLSGTGSVNTFMTMRDGFFYIANGESKKIMELNSYGDLLSLFYNEEFTNSPSFSSKNAESSTKKAIAYPFNTLGPIAVDSRKYLYAVDTLPVERQEVDKENRLLLQYVVLRFASDGTFMDYLLGPEGAPFPYIKNIYTTRSNELVVVCTTNDGPVVYWFNADGALLYTIPFTKDTVPDPYKESEGEEMFVSIENVIPDTSLNRLYLLVNYFGTALDPTLKTQSGVEYTHTLLYPLDVLTGRYDAPLEIPAHEEAVSENLSKEVFSIPYDFLGVTDSGWFFFSVPVEKGFLIQMVQPNGQKVLKRLLEVDHSQILYYAMTLNGSGIISALFAKREAAQVAWWRTDSLIASFIEN